MHVIGEDCSQRLDVIPTQYRVIVIRRPQYACRTCQQAVVQAAAPARLIEGDLPIERLVAQIIVANTPITLRSIARPRSWRGTTSPSTGRPWRSVGRLCRGRAGAAVAAAARGALGSPKLFVDETTAPVLDPGRGRTKKGYSGCSPATTDRDAAARRRQGCTAMRHLPPLSTSGAGKHRTSLPKPQARFRSV